MIDLLFYFLWCLRFDLRAFDNIMGSKHDPVFRLPVCFTHHIHLINHQFILIILIQWEVCRILHCEIPILSIISICIKVGFIKHVHCMDGPQQTASLAKGHCIVSKVRPRSYFQMSSLAGGNHLNSKYSHTDSTGHSARKSSKLLKNGLLSFAKIIAWKTCMVCLKCIELWRSIMSHVCILASHHIDLPRHVRSF